MEKMVGHHDQPVLGRKRDCLINHVETDLKNNSVKLDSIHRSKGSRYWISDIFYQRCVATLLYCESAGYAVPLFYHPYSWAEYNTFFMHSERSVGYLAF